MRTLVRIIASQMVRSRVGRWALTIILFLIAAAGFIAYPSVSATQSASDGRSPRSSPASSSPYSA